MFIAWLIGVLTSVPILIYLYCNKEATIIDSDDTASMAFLGLLCFLPIADLFVAIVAGMYLLDRWLVPEWYKKRDN